MDDENMEVSVLNGSPLRIKGIHFIEQYFPYYIHNVK